MPRQLRLVALVLATLASSGAVILAVLRLVEGPQISPAPAMPIPVSPAGRAASTADQAGDWPALFGTAGSAEAPVPVGPAQPEGTYALRGIVTSGDAGWAIVNDGGREVLVRPGDEIEPGWVVEAIDADHLVIVSGADEAVIRFSDDDRVRTVEIAEENRSGGEIRPAQEVRTPVATPSELRDMILRAEAERVARGLAAPPRSTR